LPIADFGAYRASLLADSPTRSISSRRLADQERLFSPDFADHERLFSSDFVDQERLFSPDFADSLIPIR
jgi:hypothetical protein